MTEQSKIGCVVMAAGSARRFGSNKLKIELDGQSLFRRSLDAVPVQQFESVVVVTQYPEFEEVIRDRGFTLIRNDRPELGLSHTIHLGLKALEHCDAVLFQVADQPLLQQESVDELCELWRKEPEKIAIFCHGERRGNPCIFPARFFQELMAIEGDRGGSVVIKAHPEAILRKEVPEEELYDVDTAQAFAELSSRSE